jgi:hypothetical protein
MSKVDGCRTRQDRFCGGAGARLGTARRHHATLSDDNGGASRRRLCGRSAYGPDNPWFRATASRTGQFGRGGIEWDVDFAEADSKLRGDRCRLSHQVRQYGPRSSALWSAK